MKVYIAGKITGECETPELFQECDAHLKRLGFNETVGMPTNYSIHHPICGKYEVDLLPVQGGEEANEILGSVIVSVTKYPPDSEDSITEILAVTITNVQQLELLVTATRTWRFMHL